MLRGALKPVAVTLLAFRILSTIPYTMTFRVLPQTGFIRLVSSQLVLRGVPVLRDGRCDRFLKKKTFFFTIGHVCE